MFGFFKKKQSDAKTDSPSQNGPLISAVLLKGKSFPFQQFAKELMTLEIPGVKIGKAELKDDGMLSFMAGKDFAALALMPAPYPASDLEGPLATSWMWPDDQDINTIRKHQSHLLITMTGGTASPIKRRLTQTALTALAAKMPGVMAVYWAESTLLHYPPVFSEMAETIDSPDAPPLYLWVDYRIYGNKDGTIGAFTTGLVPLGLMEIEIPSIAMEVGELREWLVNISYYLIENGPVLKDGDTIGVSAEHQMKIRHAKSQVGHTGKVIRLTE